MHHWSARHKSMRLRKCLHFSFAYFSSHYSFLLPSFLLLLLLLSLGQQRVVFCNIHICVNLNNTKEKEKKQLVYALGQEIINIACTHCRKWDMAAAAIGCNFSELVAFYFYFFHPSPIGISALYLVLLFFLILSAYPWIHRTCIIVPSCRSSARALADISKLFIGLYQNLRAFNAPLINVPGGNNFFFVHISLFFLIGGRFITLL